VPAPNLGIEQRGIGAGPTAFSSAPCAISDGSASSSANAAKTSSLVSNPACSRATIAAALAVFFANAPSPSFV
jgi:hypothetical protein